MATKAKDEPTPSTKYMRMLNGGSQKSKVDPWLSCEKASKKKGKFHPNFMFSRPVHFYGGVRQCPLKLYTPTQPTTHHTAESSIISRRRKLRRAGVVRSARASIGGGGGAGGGRS